MYEEIRYEVAGPSAIITLSRPQAMNAFTESMEVEIHDAMRRAVADRDVVGIVLTGEGRGFCAGADMNLLGSIIAGNRAAAEPAAAPAPTSSDPTLTPAGGEFGGRFPFMMTMPKPVIAAINGAVAGMAFPMVLCCDLRVMSTDAVMITSFAQRGLIAEWGLSWLLPRLVGPAVTLDLLFSSRKVGGEEAYRLGLVNAVVEPGEVVGWATAYIERLAAGSSPTSMAVMKRQVYEQLHVGLGQAELESVRLMRESFNRPDFAEGVASFKERRRPRFAPLSTFEG